MTSSIHIERLEQCKVIATYTNKLASPLVIDDEVYCVAENGDILKLKKDGGVEVVFTILGQPSSLAFKDGDNIFLISDFAHQSIFSRDESSNMQINHLITEYDNHAFLGPNSIKVGPFTKNVYFTDSGPFQETSIESRLGSVFVLRSQNQKLKCLTFRTLAYPSGLQVDEQQKYLLVCEMGENRVLKYMLDENLNGNSTVFHQFSGRFGPSAICGYDSRFYVALYEFNNLCSSGIIAVLNGLGQIEQRLSIQTGGEIDGLFLYEQSNQKEEQIMLVSEGNSIYRVPLRNSEGEKMQESIVISKN